MRAVPPPHVRPHEIDALALLPPRQLVIGDEPAVPEQPHWVTAACSCMHDDTAAEILIGGNFVVVLSLGAVAGVASSSLLHAPTRMSSCPSPSTSPTPATA